jgi:uncharacterized protein YjbI with pentapeptide repeats
MNVPLCAGLRIHAVTLGLCCNFQLGALIVAGRSEELRLLRGRWQVPDLQAAVAGARQALLRGGPVVSPFPDVAGRVDLRGLPVSGAVADWRDLTPRLSAGSDPSHGPSAARRAVWEGLDLTGAELWEMNWTQLAARDCVLDDSDLTGLRCWGVDVAGCSMRRAKIFHGQLGAPTQYWPRRSQWRDVDLRQADLRGATASGLFQDADFRNAKFQRTDFGWSDLVNCRFAGVVLGLTIGHRPITEQPPRWLLSGVDFTAATPRRLELIGVSLDVADIRLPADADHWLVSGWPDYLQRLAAAVAVLREGTLKLTASIWLDYAIRDQGPGQMTGFIAAWDLTQLGGTELRDLLDNVRKGAPGRVSRPAR